MIREVQPRDLMPLLRLYTHLHSQPMPDAPPEALWREILADPNHHIVVAEEDGLLVSSCVVVVVPNLTHCQRPYALVEMVVTHAEYRGRGLATAVLDYARDTARANGCYKIMLMTGSKLESTLRFYERAGYSSADKTGFVQWLE